MKCLPVAITIKSNIQDFSHKKRPRTWLKTLSPSSFILYFMLLMFPKHYPAGVYSSIFEFVISFCRESFFTYHISDLDMITDMFWIDLKERRHVWDQFVLAIKIIISSLVLSNKIKRQTVLHFQTIINTSPTKYEHSLAAIIVQTKYSSHQELKWRTENYIHG